MLSLLLPFTRRSMLWLRLEDLLLQTEVFTRLRSL